MRLQNIFFAPFLLSPKALKVLRTSEFLPYVVFIEAPDFEVLKAMNKSAIESGVVTKQLTVSLLTRTNALALVEHSRLGNISIKIWWFHRTLSNE